MPSIQALDISQQAPAELWLVSGAAGGVSTAQFSQLRCSCFGTSLVTFTDSGRGRRQRLSSMLWWVLTAESMGA